MTVKGLFSWKPVEIALLAGLAVCLLSGGMAMKAQQQLADRMIRLHVLANSDSEADQALKLEVRDAVTERTAVLLERVADRQEAERILRRHLTELEQVAKDTVRAAGYVYDVNVELSMTDFPTKEYDGFSLPAGEYLALRVLIGEAAGQNWWCVVFPTLCVGATVEEFEASAHCAGFSEALTGALTGEEPYEVRFFLLDAMGRLENFLHKG